ncbi:hypothetical protein D3C76_1296540 [compost metagenome]
MPLGCPRRLCEAPRLLLHGDLLGFAGLDFAFDEVALFDFFLVAAEPGAGGIFSIISLRMFMPVRRSLSHAAMKLTLLKKGMPIEPSTYRWRMIP